MPLATHSAGIPFKICSECSACMREYDNSRNAVKEAYQDFSRNRSTRLVPSRSQVSCGGTPRTCPRHGGMSRNGTRNRGPRATALPPPVPTSHGGRAALQEHGARAVRTRRSASTTRRCSSH
ncbi:hypothetical protein BC834DRAFT_341356 [Gloeopeniophorella convolvens]|nr:hypothetical protein BC834DRAFT_341356 [Gloeopeniophorella convolvens]